MVYPRSKYEVDWGASDVEISREATNKQRDAACCSSAHKARTVTREKRRDERQGHGQGRKDKRVEEWQGQDESNWRTWQTKRRKRWGRRKLILSTHLPFPHPPSFSVHRIVKVGRRDGGPKLAAGRCAEVKSVAVAAVEGAPPGPWSFLVS